MSAKGMEDISGKRAPLGKGIDKGRAMEAMLILLRWKISGLGARVLLSATDHVGSLGVVLVSVKEYGKRRFYKKGL
jgi:hypothetical protein